MIVKYGSDGLIFGAVAAEARVIAETGVQPGGLPHSQTVSNQVSSLGYLGVAEKNIQEDYSVCGFEL
jgi:hypothetical protein